LKEKLFEIKQSKTSEIVIYTGDSEDQNRVSASAVIENIFSICLPNDSIIFTAEVKSIQLPFKQFKISIDKRFTIFSVSHFLYKQPKT
jgi:hypothetical protein